MDPAVRGLAQELSAWPGGVLKRHNDSGHLLHKATFLADLGLRAGDPGIDAIAGRMLAHCDPEDIPQVCVNISPAYGGTGQDRLAWSLCDAPLVLYALVRFGLGDDSRVKSAVSKLAALLRDNGWPCATSPDLSFRGPGRKADPCPFATLAMLKLLAVLPDAHATHAIAGSEALLALWQKRTECRPYLFGMGSDFCKLKAPLVWYDILHTLDVLSRFSHLAGDARLVEMITVVRSRADEYGRFTAGSVWMPWKDWEFGQKRVPSRWITLLISRVCDRTHTSWGV